LNLFRSILLLGIAFQLNVQAQVVGLDCIPKPGQFELVLVDTGNSHTRRGILDMPANLFPLHPHGTHMADNVEDELQALRAQPVHAVESTWVPHTETTGAIRYAVWLRPKVISMSLSGRAMDEGEAEALQEAQARGILMVAAAGNEGPAVKRPYYPAALNFPCMVSVGTTVHGRWRDSSQHGVVAHPYVEGDPIGTSSSTARMAAQAIRYFQLHPGATCQQAKAWLIRQFPPPR
jgi:hypothetical protein